MTPIPMSSPRPRSSTNMSIRVFARALRSSRPTGCRSAPARRAARPGVQDDAAESRVRDMDDEGTDTHFCIPTAWTSLVGHDDPTLEVNVIRAYHRHLSDFSSQYPDRLKSMIVASARDVDAAVHE